MSDPIVIGKRGNKVLGTKISQAVITNRRLSCLEISVQGYSSTHAINSIRLNSQQGRTVLDHYNANNPAYLRGKVVRSYYDGHTLVGIELNGEV